METLWRLMARPDRLGSTTEERRLCRKAIALETKKPSTGYRIQSCRICCTARLCRDYGTERWSCDPDRRYWEQCYVVQMRQPSLLSSISLSARRKSVPRGPGGARRRAHTGARRTKPGASAGECRWAAIAII